MGAGVNALARPPGPKAQVLSETGTTGSGPLAPAIDRGCQNVAIVGETSLCGDKEPRSAKPLISQGFGGRRPALSGSVIAVDRGGIEPPTPGFSVLCSTN